MSEAPPPKPRPAARLLTGLRGIAVRAEGEVLILHVLRALLVLTLAAVGWFFVKADPSAMGTLDDSKYELLAFAVIAGVVVVCIDILSSRRKLAIFSGTFLGLVVGLALAYALSFITALLVDQFGSALQENGRTAITQYLNLVLGVICCYLAISFILQTKDDFRFIIPYVEFRKQTRGNRPILLDTSVLIDGRVADVAGTGIFDARLIVPRFVLLELQTVADSADRLKRNRGRRGLDVLADLQQMPGLDVLIYDSSGRDARLGREGGHVDERLMALATELGGRVLTADFNLNKVAQLGGVEVLNLNDLANALKPEVLPGEGLLVHIVKPGEEAGQGVGYLDDGTMVVVEGGGGHVDEDVSFTITNTRQTSAGKMIFGRLGDSPPPAPRPARRPPARR